MVADIIHLYNYLVNFSGSSTTNLANTGSVLYSLITGVSASGGAGVSSINGQIGALNIYSTGDSHLFVNSAGGNIFISGSGMANSGDLSTINNNLYTTGHNLYNDIIGFSGQLNANYATTANLTQTGITIEAQINSLSGYSNAVFSTVSNLQSTGSLLYQDLVGLSGQNNTNFSTISNLALTGSNLYIDITGLSGQFNTNNATVTNLYITGSTLYMDMTGMSGQSNINYSTISNLYLTGSNLYNDLTGFSGQSNINYSTVVNLGLTGSNLYIDITGLSGVFNNSGGQYQTQINNANNNLQLTGQQLYIESNNNSTNLSGNLTLTGAVIYNDIIGLSGLVNNIYSNKNFIYTTGNLQSITGSINILGQLSLNSGFKTPVQYYGVSNFNLISGNYIVIATGSSTNITGILPNPTSYSGISFSLINNTNGPLQISGSIGADINPVVYQYDCIEVYATSGIWNYIRQTGSALTTVVSTLSNNLTSLSGYSASSVNLYVTGSYLYNTLTGLSGQSNLNYATIINLANTGTLLYNDLVGLSGQINNNAATIANLASTGSYLYNTVTGFSGVFVNSGAQYQTQINNLNTSLQLTGQQSWGAANNNGINLSGNLASTGTALYNDIVNFSGQLNANYATNSNLTLTGANLITRDNSISGALQVEINTINSLPQIYIGSGNPEGILSAISGSIYTDWFNREFYQKITGSSVNGWI